MLPAFVLHHGHMLHQQNGMNVKNADVLDSI